MTNLQKLAAIFDWVKSLYDAVFNGGGSMLHKESLQWQIERVGERTWKKPLIGPFKGADKKEYFTTPSQQAQYDALALARIEGELAAMKNLLSQMANAFTSGVDLKIDYAQINAAIKAAMPDIPEYELTKKEN